MINTLHIKNIGIIDDLTINLNEGFNVLTGETGAGKTLIINSFQLLAGGRFTKEMIRTGESEAFVEMSAYIPNKGFEEDTLIVSREINLKGKNVCKINGRLVTVSALKSFMSEIIDIHGQNETLSMLDVSTHLALLDEYSSNKIRKLKKSYIKLYDEYLKIKGELNKNYGDDREKQRKLDLLNYQVDEIEAANLKDCDEEEKLIEKRTRMMSSEKIRENLFDAEANLSDNAIESISKAIKDLEKIEKYDEEYANILTRIRESYYEIQEASRDISYLSSDISFDEEEQNEVEERLDLIKSLKRKYGNNIEEILEYKEQVESEIFEIQNLESYISELKVKLNNIEEKMYEISLEMNEVRIEAGKKLEVKINKELEELDMKSAKLKIEIKLLDNKEFNKNGLNSVEFKISTNVGEQSKSLVKIASGGEMSRIMLAMKSVLANVDKIPIMIFDEIDTGISGMAANATGEKIKKISKNHQVICVTHLASIAAKGDHNFYVSKEVDSGKTRTKVKELSEEEVLKEIARISTGNITNISIKQAKELRNGKLQEIA